MEQRLYQWLLERVTEREEGAEGVRGIVEHGHAIPYKRLAEELQVSERTIMNWIGKLKVQKQLQNKRHQYGYSYEITLD